MKIRFISMLLILCMVFPSLVGFTATDESLTDDDIASLKIDEAPPESDVMATATGDEVISLNYSTLALAHNNTRTITATTNPSGLTVTWTSSNPSVAPVTSSGSVTGSKSGTAVITASVTDSYGNTHVAQCTVYVYLQSGVYYIKNMNSGQYIRPFSGSIQNYADVVQGTRVDPSTAVDIHILHQTWKIKHLGSGRYSIRPLYKLDMGLDVTSGVVDIYKIGTDDTLSGVPSCCEWTIEWNSTGYVLKNNGYSSKVMQVQSASTSAGASIIVGSNGNNANCKWELEQFIGAPTGVMLYDTESDSKVVNPKRYTAPDEARDITSLTLIPIYYSPVNINQTFTWSSSNTSVATVNSSGKVTGKSPGTVTITAKSAQNTSLTVSYTLEVTGIANGIYFLRNKQTLRFADIQGPTMANGTTIHQWQFNGNDSQKWIFKHQGDGFYTIKSANSSTAYYLGVINNAVVVNSDIVLSGGEIESGMLWRVTVTDNGAFQITGKNGITNNYALATANATQTNGVKLIHGAYIDNDSYCDEWELGRIVESIVECEPQQKSLWCWAATARMLAKHYYPTVTITQSQAVSHIKGSTSNVSGSSEDVITAVEHYISNISGASLDLISTGDGRIYSENTLLRFLDDGHVVIVGRVSTQSGHLCLIYGYIDFGNDVRFLVHDSLPEDEGKTYIISYEKLVYGQNLQDDEIADEYSNFAWGKSVVVETSYSGQTIAWHYGE